jgi:hypothetical protein
MEEGTDMRPSKFLPILLTVAFTASAAAQTQSSAPADRALAQNISTALVKAGIDPRITSVQVVTTANHIVYLKGLISDPKLVKLAGDTAAKTAPGYHVVNNIRSSFFDDPNHVSGGKTK